MKLNLIKTALLISFCTHVLSAQGGSSVMYFGDDQQLSHVSEMESNRIPDFSQTGYEGGVVPLLKVGTIEQKKLRIYILAGQSNMVGHAQIATFDYIGDDPKTVEMLNEMRDSNGKPRIVENTWISYFQSDESN